MLQGYAGGDESRMLQRRLSDTSAKIGVGANRAAVASFMLQKYGYIHHHSADTFCNNNLESGQIGVAILDDGMQVRCLSFLFPSDEFGWEHDI